MAGKVTGLQMAYAIDATNQNTENNNYNEIPQYRLVKLVSAGKVALAGANDIVVGVVSNDARLYAGYSSPGNQAGKNIAVQLEGIGAVVLSGTVSAGDRIIASENGKAQKIGTTSGNYNVVGYAETSGVAGDVIYFRIEQHSVYVE